LYEQRIGWCLAYSRAEEKKCAHEKESKYGIISKTGWGEGVGVPSLGFADSAWGKGGKYRKRKKEVGGTDLGTNKL